MLKFLWPLMLFISAVFEVGGDAATRAGLRGKGIIYSIVGFALLGLYGIGVNKLDWNLSKLLGTYVAFFAVVSIWWGWYFNNELISRSTGVGLLLIVIGGCLISRSEITALIRDCLEAVRSLW
jgi:small multidrug resistance family-3 protein